MFSTSNLISYAQWAGYATLFFAVLAVVGWLLKWSFRFRLVGVTGFMGVMTAGLFALSLGLYDRTEIPGAVKLSRVYDTGTNQIVILVPATVNTEQLDATLQQAAADLYSPGRLSQGDPKLTIRVRTILHPEPGVSQLVYLGQVQRSLLSRHDDQVVVELFPDQISQLPKPSA